METWVLHARKKLVGLGSCRLEKDEFSEGQDFFVQIHRL